MASTADTASKDRILKHLNQDHGDSLSLYLRHYQGVAADAAANAVLLDISHEQLTIRASPPDQTIYTVAITPPMRSWADARPRTVAMDEECRRALGVAVAEGKSHDSASGGQRSPPTRYTVQLDRYIPPDTPFQRTVFGLCVLTFGLFVTRAAGLLSPGTWAHRHVLSWWPLGSNGGGGGDARADHFLWTLDMIAVPTLVVHVAEAVALDLVRLQPYGVARGSRLWWQWMGSCFLEGFGAWKRTGKEISRLRRAVKDR